MNLSTWNLFEGLNEIILICFASIGFLSVIVVIVTASKKVNKRETNLSKVSKFQTLEPEESVLNIEN